MSVVLAVPSIDWLRAIPVQRMIERVLLAAMVFGVTGFVLLVLIGLWDRYEKQAAASGFNEADGRYLAPQSVSPRESDSRALAKHAPQVAVHRDTRGSAQVVQEEANLATSHAFEGTSQGMSVALSADGGTAIVGGPGPHNADLGRSPKVGSAGAAWVFTRSHGIWTQQGSKLVGATSEYGGGLWSQGASVALSADGNTAIVGGPSDNETKGAAWLFTRAGGVWTQQGNKLVGSGADRAGESQLPRGQGMAVALSADGNTAIIGGWGTETAWVFTRKGSGVWIQEGTLVGDGAVGRAHRGMSVALSADGNTAIVGGWSDNSKAGAAWVFSRSRGVWAQQGKKLVGTGAVGNANQGWSVALSAEGNTAILGGPGDNMWDPSVPFGLGAAGAAWVFTRNGSSWTQEGEKLVSPKSARQGTSVAVSADGNIAVIGGLVEDGGGGSGLVFTRDGAQWRLDKKLVGTSAIGKSAPSVALSADGNVIMIGGSNDNGGIGAAWMFAHSGDGWSEGKKLIGTEVQTFGRGLLRRQ
jgi:hypothetical protein